MVFFVILLSGCVEKEELKVEKLEKFPYNTEIRGEFVDVRKYSSKGQFFFVLQVDLKSPSDQERVSEAPFSLISDSQEIKKMINNMEKYFEKSRFSHSDIHCFKGLDRSGFWMKIVKMGGKCFILADKI